MYFVDSLAFLTFDGSKEQCNNNTTFLKQIRKCGIKYHISEPKVHNQNPVEGVIRKIRRKWFRTMARKSVSRKLWDYGMVWCSGIISLTHSTAGPFENGIPQEFITGEIEDISEYLDFGFYILCGTRIMGVYQKKNLAGG